MLLTSTFEEGIDKIRGYQHNHHVMYDKGRRDLREVCCGNVVPVTDYCQTHMKSVLKKDESKLTKRIGTLEETLVTLLNEIKRMPRKLKDPSTRSG